MRLSLHPALLPSKDPSPNLKSNHSAGKRHCSADAKQMGVGWVWDFGVSFDPEGKVALARLIGRGPEMRALSID